MARLTQRHSVGGNMDIQESKTAENKASHKRINQSLLYTLEKPILLWLAKHMPGKINSDHMSLLGFLAAIMIGVSYPLADNQPVFLWAAVAGYVLNWFGDSLDGTLARYRKQERPRYGYFLDHSIDVISITIILTGLGFSSFSRIELAWGVNLLYLLMIIYTSLANFTSRKFQISFAAVGPTEIRILGIIASIWLYFNDTRIVHLGSLDMNFFETLMLLLIIIFIPIYLVTTIVQILHLAKEEPLPNRS